LHAEQGSLPVQVAASDTLAKAMMDHIMATAVLIVVFI
jgi:hypothetical protein